jgi:glucosamine-6-phosphate deaminase
MSIKQIMKSEHIICSVPDARKATAVRNTLKSEVSPMVPASVMQLHQSTWLFLDKASASKL